MRRIVAINGGFLPFRRRNNQYLVYVAGGGLHLENGYRSAQISPQGDPIAAGVEGPLRGPGEKFRFGGCRSSLKRVGSSAEGEGQFGCLLTGTGERLNVRFWL